MKFFEFLGKLLSSLFSPTSPTTDDRRDPQPQPDRDEPKEVPEVPPTNVEMLSDSSDLPRDTTVLVEDLPFEIEPGTVIDDPKEEEPTPGDDGLPEEEKEDLKETTTTNKRYMWCLDNGHAEDTPGKRSAPFELNGINIQFFEYEFNRDIVGRIIAKLRENDIEFFNVVPEDKEDIKLSERVRRANNLPSDLPKLYVSVHANAGPTRPGTQWVAPSISGIETWHYHRSSKGTKMAAIFQRELIEATGWKNRKLKTTKEKALYVLKYTSMPAILTENGFFNNREEVEELMQDDVRQAIADAHVAAILEIEKKGL
ncbi:MAG: N-acetylmuramoyl-L-alanine amidase [Bacteroidota bacterium]